MVGALSNVGYAKLGRVRSYLRSRTGFAYQVNLPPKGMCALSALVPSFIDRAISSFCLAGN